jgi:putative sigma-54 modulation protein
MKLQMHSIHFDADKKLTDFIQKRINKLETFYDRIVDGEVIMRLEKDDQNHNKTIEFKINIPGESNCLSSRRTKHLKPRLTRRSKPLKDS